MSALPQALLAPGALASEPVELIETHISWVFRSTERVWKVKRPVQTSFLDFRSPEQRRHMCLEEVRLNRRFAPDVYSGVVPIRQGSDGGIGLREPGEVVDWAVEMRRLYDHQRADRMLDEGALDAHHIEAFVSLLASVHGVQPPRRDTRAAQTVADNLWEDLDRALAEVAGQAGEPQAEHLREWARSPAPTRGIDAREEAGWVREGHGDYRLEHLYLEQQGPVALDGVEFNKRFRIADVALDLAYLSSDLRRRGRSDLAEDALRFYVRQTSNAGLYAVIDAYETNRLLVRLKVASFHRESASQPLVDDAAATTATLLAERPSSARLVAMAGPVAAGKSTLADALGDSLHAPVLDADRTRKRMFGHSPGDDIRAVPDAYSASTSDAVYRALLDGARAVLSSGRTAVLDASFRSPRHRQGLRDLARELEAPLLLVWCQAPRAVLAQRLAARSTGSISDARPETLEAILSTTTPPDEVPPNQRLLLDTRSPKTQLLDAIQRRLLQM